MDFRAIGMGLIFALIWSSAFTSARMILEAAPPLYALVLRFGLAGLIGVAIAKALGQNWNFSRAQWRGIVIFGTCQNAVYLGLNFIAMQTVEAGLAAIIASSMPLLVAGTNWIVFRETLPKLGVVGLIAGFAGVALIMSQRLTGGADVTGLALCVIAAVALTIATLTVRSVSASGQNVIMGVGLQMAVGSLVLLPFALIFETPEFEMSQRLFWAFTYTTLAPGLLATWIWFLLVARIGATRAATFHFLNPFFGVAIASILLGEQLSVVDVVGVSIIAGGILAVQLARAAPASEH
ncbi:DMT family transporter [Rhodobacteraceae bacterium XHP0102]|nr:DMT family transporter [Rhodobacteraceae bacterium XHP0102]